MLTQFVFCSFFVPSFGAMLAKDSANISLDLGQQKLVIRGIKEVMVSDSLKANFIPANNQIVFGQGRDLVDERDKLIESRASALAYQVLMLGMIVVGFVLPFSATRWELIDTAFFAIVVAEIVHSVVIVRAYRQGIHV